jgi:membrane-bound lytic murein transglycosylase D
MATCRVRETVLSGFKLAELKTFRFTIGVLALLLCTPVSAAESLALVRTLEWHTDTASEPIDRSEAPDPADQDDVWQRIRAGFKIDDAASGNPLVAVHENWYASRPDYVRRMVERSRRYMFHIVEEVDRRAMPMEIALLPMIESAFNPTALSPSSASGIWQFIPSTGRLYGLKQDTWYDGRRDFTAATNAALDYLGKLYLDFGDWELALAAYNCGEGCVARAIQKNVDQGLPTDYASLSLPTETRNYVPKLIAIKNLVLDPERYGIVIDTLPNEPYFGQVTVNASLDIRSAARLAGMSRDEFVALNAAFPRNLIRSDTPVNLLVPVDKADKFQHNLESGTWDSWQAYAAQKGERPEAIAKRFEVSVARLKEHNQFHLKRGKLARAQTILVPIKGRGVVEAQAAMPDLETADINQHVVRRGDTLYSVARRYDLSVTQLTQANPDLDGNLKAGQILRVPLSEPPPQQSNAIQHVAFKPQRSRSVQTNRYTVKRGDTLHAIAQQFDVSLAEIREWNPAFRKSSAIRAGQNVLVSKP